MLYIVLYVDNMYKKCILINLWMKCKLNYKIILQQLDLQILKMDFNFILKPTFIRIMANNNNKKWLKVNN